MTAVDYWLSDEEISRPLASTPASITVPGFQPSEFIAPSASHDAPLALSLYRDAASAVMGIGPDGPCSLNQPFELCGSYRPSLSRLVNHGQSA